MPEQDGYISWVHNWRDVVKLKVGQKGFQQLLHGYFKERNNSSVQSHTQEVFYPRSNAQPCQQPLLLLQSTHSTLSTHCQRLCMLATTFVESVDSVDSIFHFISPQALCHAPQARSIFWRDLTLNTPCRLDRDKKPWQLHGPDNRCLVNRPAPPLRTFSAFPDFCYL